MIPKSAAFVQDVSGELKYKTGFSLYVDVNNASLDSKQKREDYKNSVISKLSPPYGVLFFFRQPKKIDIVLSEDSQNIFDIDQIYFDYIAPLLPEKDLDLTPQRISAIILNGYSEIADRIAHNYGVTLENNFPSENQNLFVRVVLYLMLFTLVGLFILVYFFQRHKK
ncbi:TPM domain-containing protein [Helicobacter sp. 11S02596-1]|uniref:TPM domain-containing protein n=1 Tax=Helicobacter sp. 11S02596-1 TaxID=1476194 RepID=UPI0015DFE6B4|nr:TPM domain-containing protein [Helicobacter sp. 11S02596-1]